MAITDTLLKNCSLTTWNGNKKNCRWCNRPLTGRQRRWCCDQHGAWAWSNHWYSPAREYALQRDKSRCTKCGAKHLKLEVNHKKMAMGQHNKCSCIHHWDNLEVLCAPCHKRITNTQRSLGWKDPIHKV